MPFHKTILPLIAGAVPIVGPTLLQPIVSGLLNGGPAQITPQFFGQPVPQQLVSTVITDPLVWIPGVGFSGSDPAQRALAEKIRQTEKLTTDQIVALHQNTSKDQFLIDGRRLLLELASAPVPVALAAAPVPSMVPSQLATFQQQPLPPVQGFAQPAFAQALVPAAAAVGGVVGRAGLVSFFSKIFTAVGIGSGVKALLTWIRTNPGTAGTIALGAGLTVDELFDSVAEDSIKRGIVLSKSDMKGFSRTVRVAKKLRRFAGTRTRTRKVPCIPRCPTPGIPAC